MSIGAKPEPAQREAKLDDMLDDTFPASDPPSTTPPSGTRKSRDMQEAHDRGPQGSPSGDRHAAESAAGRTAAQADPEKHAQPEKP